MKIKFNNPFRKRESKKGETQSVKPKEQYYNRDAIDATGAAYRLIIGQRSNGKTYSVLKTIIEQYFKEGKRSAYIRRYAEEIMPKNCQLLFSQPSLVKMIVELSGGEYNGTFYRANCFYFAFYDEDGKKQSQDIVPFCITRAINTWETTKGQDAGELHLICFDEFMTRSGYLGDEFVKYCNLLSSLIRDRKDCVIYMLANSVNKYSPYFEEMGLQDVDKMEQGEIRVYHYSNSELTVAVEYCSSVEATKKTASKYFAFENAQLAMITSGAWEIKNYPKAPYPIYEEDIFKRFYIGFGEQLICGEIILKSPDLFIFFRRQTKDIEIDELTPYYTNQFTTSRCHVRFLKDCPTELHALIKDLILKNSMCFANNEVGEVIRNWLQEDNGITGLL